MYTGAVSANGLTDALKRCEPATVHRSYNYKNVGDVEVLLTPKDIARRRLGALWHFGRPKFSLGSDRERAGQQLAYGLAAGKVSFPDKCAICLGEPSQAAVWEMHAGMLEGGSSKYRGKDRRVLDAANLQRVWYSVPFCTAHAAKPGAVAFGLTMNNRGWIAFRNNEYASEFGDINNIAPRYFVRRWWAALALLAALLLFLGGGIIASVLSEDSAADDLAVAAILLALGAGLFAYLYRVLVAPWNSRRKSGEPPPSGQGVVDAHHDRGDGYCSVCKRPWPCPASRS